MTKTTKTSDRRYPYGCYCCCFNGWANCIATLLILGYLSYMMGLVGVRTNHRRTYPLTMMTVVDHEEMDSQKNSTHTATTSSKNTSTTVPLISVVIMNYARPRMLQQSRLLPELLQHPSVDEILLCHAHPNTSFAWDHPKITHVDAVALNDRFGLALRFHVCAHRAQHDWVLHVDDDMELDASAVTTLVQLLQAQPHRLVGHYGRRYNYWRVPHRLGYDYATVLSGPVEVVLTKLLLMERNVCGEFFKYADLVDDLVRAPGTPPPLWNGEDIFVNLVANHYYQVPLNGPYNNYAVSDLHVWEAPNALKDDNGNESATTNRDISGNLDRYAWGSRQYLVHWWKALQHYRHRGHLWSTAKARLAAMRSIDLENSH